jgi:hypothetical protein
MRQAREMSLVGDAQREEVRMVNPQFVRNAVDLASSVVEMASSVAATANRQRISASFWS